MLKMEKEYKSLYGDIPCDDNERMEYAKSLGNYESHKNEIDNILRTKIKWKTLHYTFYLIPKGTPRPRENKKSGVFYVKGAANNRKFFNKFISEISSVYITTPCIFICKSYLPIPKSMKYIEKIAAEAGIIRPIVTPDWDNLGKTYSDMIKGTLLYDDRLIITGVSSKYYSVKPRIEVTIKYMEDFNSEYNKKLMKGKVKADESNIQKD